MKLSTGQEGGQEKRRGIRDEFNFSVPRVMSAGSPACPQWWFNILPGEDYLRGNIINQVIGEIESDSTTKKSEINAHIDIIKNSIKLIDSDGLLISLARNSKLMLLRALVRKAVFDEFKSNLRPIDLEVTSHG